MGAGGNEEGSAVAVAVADGGGLLAGMKKGPWTAAEDAILMEYVRKHGEGNWNAVQKNSGLYRCGKSCRLRWANHLRPNLKKGSFSPEEELLILRLHAQLGNKWARMAAQLPGRTDNEIKNYWNTRIKRRQRAGLPLYPPEIKRHPAALHHYRASPPPTPTSADHRAHFSPTATFFSPNPFESKPVFQLPLINKFHGDGGLTFPFPVYQQQQFNSGNFNHSPMAAMKTELPSTQSFPEQGGDVGSGLLDALLQEPRAGGVEGGNWATVGANGGGSQVCQNTALGLVSKLDGSDSSLGHGIKKKAEPAEGINQPIHEDISTLLDMIPPTTMPHATSTLHWYNNPNAEMSNGRSSSAMTDGEIGLETQQMASSLSIAPVDGDWNIGSCSWNNMPGIC